MAVVNQNLESKSLKELTALVNDKKQLVVVLADKYNKAPRSISNHWLNGFYSVPKSLESAVKADMVQFILKENEAI